MSLRTFIDNVINLAVESCFVSEIPSILTPSKVSDISAEKLKELASEPEDAEAERQMLQREIDVLKTALRECRQHKPRELGGAFPNNYPSVIWHVGT